MIINSTQFAILGIAAFALTGLLTWPVRALAIRLGAMDAPNMARKTQAEPVPYLGGVAIALGISIITLGAVFVGADNFAGENNDQLKDLALTVLLPALALGAMGLLDDLRSLSPWPRLITQTLIGTVVAFVIVQNGTIGTPFGDSNSGSWINTAVTIFWIVGICNSINFFDNLDGAASGAVAIAALGVFVIAYDREQELVSALSIVTAGATVGFLMWNKSPAKIYMGDAGSIFLGFLVGYSFLELSISGYLLHALCLYVYPIIDCSICIFRKFLKGYLPWERQGDYFFLKIKKKVPEDYILYASLFIFISATTQGFINFLIIFLAIKFNEPLFLVLCIINVFILLMVYNYLGNASRKNLKKIKILIFKKIKKTF
jgi:UDP-GlcNAc:undecaprenyl-phosphate GlcNAc-1-phosphate transferase